MFDLSGEKLIISPRCKAGWTPLYSACHHNNIEVVRLLLDLGASTSITTNLQKSPLHAAAGQGFADIVQVLLDAGAYYYNGVGVCAVLCLSYLNAVYGECRQCLV